MRPCSLFNLVFTLILFSTILSCTTRYTQDTDLNNDSEVSEEVEVNIAEENFEEIENIKKTTIVKALNSDSEWADSVFNTLTAEEKIGQLIMVQAFSNMDKRHVDSLVRAVQDYKVGGLVVSLGGPVRQAKLMNKLQSLAKVPLLLAMDAEWGLGMRLDSTVSYPFMMTLGAIQDDSIIYQMGKEVAEQFKRIGMHVNFAPVVDVNNNPNNPIINYRSFGENKYKVADKGIAYMRGMQNHGIIAVAKHFPGHGDTDVDSHADLPIIPFTRERLDTLELYPFRELINNGIGGIMVAHLSIPELDATKNLPSTLSVPIVSQLLKDELNFEGLIFTDAMNMKGVTKYFKNGEADLRAIMAGNDILEITENAKVAIARIKRAILEGDIAQEEIDRRCKKVLAAKYWAGLNEYTPIKTENLIADLHTAGNDSTRRYMAEKSITLINNQNGIVPLHGNDQKVATLSLGTTKISWFQTSLQSKDIAQTHFYLPKNATRKAILALKEKLKAFDHVVVGIYGSPKFPNRNLGFSAELLLYIKELTNSPQTIFSVFANAYSMAQLPNIENSAGLMVSYENNPFAEEAAAKLISGKIGASGNLPVSVNEHLKSGQGILLVPYSPAPIKRRD